ncbi:hypothetical protein FHS31_001849 [Sphingomonas vulcanisoli]|uniref:Lipoprotein n=1 Tax=Sphingomonas vulcanisoli TaxID=1658060 RepID=A0ABX0TV20_9SPHN|nr:hypothetical protein [Sphingomonas vulcanisoli]NIJ08232.1 hypothetical protein [Sphingomonas vulcanisoli]
MRALRFSIVMLGLLAVSCATPPKPAPAPPPPSAPPTPPPLPTDWRDLPETKGSWRYGTEPGGTSARFDAPEGVTQFTLRCDKATHTVGLIRTGAAPAAALTVRTSYGARTLPPAPLAAADPLLDQIAFSRGRFTIDAPGLPELVLPAWAEPGRVIEDCRS